jgi:hypothetical protein
MRDKTKKKLMLDNLLEQFPNTRKFLNKTEADERSNKNRQLTKNIKHVRNSKLKVQAEQKKLHVKFHKNKERNN